MHCRILMSTCCLASIFFIQNAASAAGGTDVVATKGEPASISQHLPAGIVDLVNDPCRTEGWSPWFSEWPNDVNHYAFQIQSTDELNRLIQKLAAVKADLRQIRLSPLKEPNGLGWVTRVPQNNDIAVIFSVGDQSRIDEWFKNLRQPFGVMEFTATPVAVPPTLTIFVQNEAVDLKQLEIPAGIEVSSGYVPGVFHKFNTKLEQQREKEAADRTANPENSSTDQKDTNPQPQDEGDVETRAALKLINSFIDSRKPKANQ